MSQHRPILETLQALKRRPEGARRPVAVYDLDSTLFSTGARNLAIANRFSEAFPHATVVLHATIHAPNPEPLCTAVHRVTDLRIEAFEL